ncbi:TPA: hypothetical protein P7484_003579 [Klebsiella pneumoniae]|nr:hypothetical protein [Klebsiella pneumoniae]HDQ3507138.1 hypothetical protein [Klebsiella pneumoniae]
MPDIIPHQQQPERLHKFHSLKGGQYWRAKNDIPEQCIEQDEVLLIESLRWVDNALHTVILRTHPSKYGKDFVFKFTDAAGRSCRTTKSFKEHRFLFNDFLDKFEFADDGQDIRSQELLAAQNRVSQLTQQMTETMSDPEALRTELLGRVEAKKASSSTPGDDKKQLPMVMELSSSTEIASLGTALSSGIDEAKIAQLQQAVEFRHEIAQAQIDWIKEKNNAISRAVMAITPYLEESAAAQLAIAEESRETLNKLMDGIKSLDLYIGKDVVVNTIREGESAPPHIPLTFVQRKLAVDEETAVFLDIGEWFDFEKLPLFFHALNNHPGLVEQIFPSQRCVVCMTTTRRYIDYQDRWANWELNAKNQTVFLMVRDGERLFQVYSGVESHLGAHTLFPTTDEQGNIFRGIDGSQVTFNDVSYTDKLKAHEMVALHYYRFLILCCGLDHRLKLFGEFYDPQDRLSFVSMAFQEKYCRFIYDHDGTGLLDDPDAKVRPSIEEYITQANSHLRSGSRVFCEWRAVCTPNTAPGVVKVDTGTSYRSYYFTADFINDEGMAVAFTRNNEICVEVPVKKDIYRRTRANDVREFNAKVSLTNFQRDPWDDASSVGFLCLDAVKADDLDYYIHSRSSRRNFMYYIKLFKRLSAVLRTEEVQEMPYRQKLIRALVDGNIGTKANRAEIVDKTVITWRADKKGQPLSEGIDNEKSWKALLGMMDLIAWRGLSHKEAAVEMAISRGSKPLRLIVTTNARLALYVTPTAEERDDRVEKHKWAMLLTFKMSAKGLTLDSSKPALLSKNSVCETTLYEWPEANEWKGLKSVFSSFHEKQRAFEYIETGKEDLRKLSPANPSEFEAGVREWMTAYCEMNDYRKTGGQVQQPRLMIPVGIYINRGDWQYIYVTTESEAAGYFYHNSSERLKKELYQEYVSRFAHPEGKLERLETRGNRLALGMTNRTPDIGMFCADRNVEMDSVNYGPLSYSAYSQLQRIENRLFFVLAEAERGLHRRIYIADNLKSDNGEFIIDKLLGSSHLQVQSAVDVFEVILPKSLSEGPLPVIKSSGEIYRIHHWFDICPKGAEANVSLSNIEAPVNKVTRHSFDSREAAIMHILMQKETVKKSVSGDRSNTPEGVVERWY